MRLATLLTLLLGATATEAQTDVFPNLWVTDARVEGMAVLGDTVFVAGRFDYIGPPTGQVAVLDAQTGVADVSQPRFSALASQFSDIREILPDGVGGYYVGGQFSVVSGQERTSLAHVLADGTLDPGFRPTLTTSSSERPNVFALALDRSAASPSGVGVLYVGGDFVSIDGQSRAALAALDAQTGAALPFDAALGRSNGATFGVGDLLALGGVVYTGGSFDTVAGQPKPNAVALDGVTGALLPWGVAANGPTFPIAASEGTVYLYGDFTAVNGQPRQFLAEVTVYDAATGGGAVTPWRPRTEVFGDDFALTPTALWAVSYTQGLRRIDRTSGAVTVGQPGCGNSRALAYDPGAGGGAGTLFSGCERPTGGSGDLYPHVVGLDAESGQPTGFDVMGATEGNSVRALAVDADRVLVGGTFVTFGAGVERRLRLAAFDLTTGLPTDFAAGRTTVGANEDLALSPDGRFLYGYSNVVGGAVLSLTEFDLATGATRDFRLQGRPEPTQMTAPSRRAGPAIAAPNPRVENPASAVVVTDDRVCVSLSGVACFDRTTAQLLFYTPLPSVNGQGENNGDLLYLPPDGPIVGPGGAQGTLFLAAPIEEAPAGMVRPAFAALDYATGALLSSWDVGFAGRRGPEGYTLALLDRDGTSGPAAPRLYLGGDREWTVQGQPRQELAAVDPATAALQPWAPRVSGGPVLAMAAQRAPGGAGVVYVGGSFSFVNGERRACCVAAFDAATGAYREDWQPISNIAFVLLASEQHQALFIGGFGQALRGTGHSGIVAVSPAAPILPTAGEAGGPEAPRSASMSLAGPNPLRSRTALAVSLPEAQAVDAALYDVLGRRVAVLHAGALPAGVSRIEVDVSALPSGVYVARVTGTAFIGALTLTVVR